MPSLKITELAELAETPAAGDVVPIVDVSTGITKKVTRANLIGGIGVDLTPIVVADYSTPAITIEDTAAGAELLSLYSRGLSGPTPIVIQPSVPADPGASGHGLTLAAGVGGLDQVGGTVEIDAGPGNGASSPGNVKLGRNESSEVLIGREGGGGSITLEGDVSILGIVDSLTVASDVQVAGQIVGDASVQVGTRLTLGAVISPASIGSHQIDYDPSGHGGESLLRLSSSAAYTIRSLANPVNGWLLLVVNVGAYALTLAHEDVTGGVTAVYRFACPGGVSLVLNPGDSVVLEYDASGSRWRAFGSAIVAGAGLTRTGNTLDVVAHSDGSILANADDLQIGVLATDAQHGSRGGGTTHAAATRATAGFMSALDKDSLYEALSRYTLRADFLTTSEAFNLTSAGTAAATQLCQGVSNGGTIAGHIGLLQSSTGTTATGRTGFWALTSASASSWVFSGGMRHGFLFKLDQLSSALQEFTVRVGAGDSISAEPSEGLYFAYDRTVSSNWIFKSARNTTRSTASGGSNVPVATGWWFLEWVANAAGTSVEAFANGVSIGTVTTNLPNSATNFFMGMHQLIKSVGTTACTVVWDACVFGHDFPVARNV